VDTDFDIGNLEAEIQATRHVLVFLTDG
jgi:hypothetical protein